MISTDLPVSTEVLAFTKASERLLSPATCPPLSGLEHRLIQHYVHELSTQPLPIRIVDAFGRRES